jgi:hypothetical protein
MTSKDATIKLRSIHLTLKATAPRHQIAALSAEAQANLAYDVFGAVADKLTECGIDPDLVAATAQDLAHKLSQLDGSPPRVVRRPPNLKRDC